MAKTESSSDVDSVMLRNSQDVGPMMASEQSTNNSTVHQHVIVRNDVHVATESDDEEFMDAHDSLLNNNDVSPLFSSLEHLPILVEQYREDSNFGTLERCGRWLMAIPRNDVLALQQTTEYKRFLEAFDKLGEVCLMSCILHFPLTFYYDGHEPHILFVFSILSTPSNSLLALIVRRIGEP